MLKQLGTLLKNGIITNRFPNYNLIKYHIHMQNQNNQNYTTLLKGKMVPVQFANHLNKEVTEKVRECKKFNDYLHKIQKSQQTVQVHKIQVVGVDLFSKGNIGFISLKAHTKKDGFSLPNFVFLRGQAVAVLVIVNGKIAVVQQYRPAVQCVLTEAPAGMIDEEGDFMSKAAQQIYEQTGIKVNKQILVPLGSYYPSPGGCDEQIHMYYCEIERQKKQLQEEQKKVHGEKNSKERIKVKFVDYSPQYILSTKDSGLIALMYAYEAKKKQKK